MCGLFLCEIIKGFHHYAIILIFLSCFGIYSDFSYFFSQFFRLQGWFWELFWRFLQFQLLFLAIFPAFGLNFGCCFRVFCGFSYFFPDLFRIFGWVWGAVWGISAVSATFSCSFPDFWRDFGCCFANFCGFSSTRPACYAINLWLLYIMIIEKSSIF